MLINPNGFSRGLLLSAERVVYAYDNYTLNTRTRTRVYNIIVARRIVIILV